MVSIRRGLQKFTSNRALFFDSIVKNFLRFLPDKLYLSLRYRCIMGRWIDWKHPQTFTEKIQWLKVFNRRPEFITMVDKYAVKEYVANIIGPDYIIPTIGVWNNPSEINWDSLPNQFVLKTTHGGGSCGVVICKDKNTLNRENTIAKLSESLKHDIYIGFREWPYRDVPRRIIAEQYIEQPNLELCTDLSDYKFFCFNGEPKVFKIDFNRFNNHKTNYFDIDGNLLPFGEADYPPILDINIEVPQNLPEMVELARKIAVGLPFARIDLYNTNGKILFGEITLFPTSGFGRFTDDKWDRLLGSWLELPNKLNNLTWNLQYQ